MTIRQSGLWKLTRRDRHTLLERGGRLINTWNGFNVLLVPSKFAMLYGAIDLNRDHGEAATAAIVAELFEPAEQETVGQLLNIMAAHRLLALNEEEGAEFIQEEHWGG